MDSWVQFAGSLLIVMGGMALIGIPLLKSLTLSIEGHREFKGDSMTRREKTRGWLGALVWSLAAIVIWSFFVDWLRAGNIEYAQDALAYRIEKIMESASRN
ncbi:MAG: hypothetical protein GQ535_02145 [Rhodobacteraceae bacterium]|nr:hypothetical protein [Paracoccaceae bacterium]